MLTSPSKPFSYKYFKNEISQTYMDRQTTTAAGDWGTKNGLKFPLSTVVINTKQCHPETLEQICHAGLHAFPYFYKCRS